MDRQSGINPLIRLILLLILLYLFFVSIKLMGASFKFFGKGFAEVLLATTANPFVGLFIGVLATSLVQSSSTTTSMTVGLVAGGALDVSRAIPIIMGANIGTSVTNTLVAVGHISRSGEFKRAFSAATIHDFFNLIAVIILFPLQLATNFLGISAVFIGGQFSSIGGFKLVNPLKIIVDPSVNLIIGLTSGSGIWMLIISIAFLFLALRYIVVNLKGLVLGKIETFFNTVLFKNAIRAMLLGIAITVLVQSSSITTSLVIPLAGAGILTIRQIFPFTLGSNVGTTITAFLASLVTGSQAAVTVAFAHLLFNLFGIAIIWRIREIPVRLAQSLAEWSLRSKMIPVAYIGVVFFLIPLILIYFLG